MCDHATCTSLPHTLIRSSDQFVNITLLQILCGSFNPLHEGHINLLQAVVAAEIKRHTGCPPPVVAFEMSVHNADKVIIPAQFLITADIQFGLNLFYISVIL